MPDVDFPQDTPSWDSVANQAATAALSNSSSIKNAAKAAASAAGAAAGTLIIPVIGTILGGLIGGLLIDVLNIKSKTEHYEWDEAEAKATPYAKATADAICSGIKASDIAELAETFPRAYRDFVHASDWWDSNTRNIYYTAYERDILKETTNYNRIMRTIWCAAHWIIENTDKNNPKEIPEKLLFFYSRTLTPLMESLGYRNYSAPGSSSTASASVPGQQSTESTTQKVASVFSGGTLGYLVAAGLLGALLFGGSQNHR